jgi:hypothetical protein
VNARLDSLWSTRAHIVRDLKQNVRARKRCWEPKATARCDLAINHCRYILRNLTLAIADEMNR